MAKRTSRRQFLKTGFASGFSLAAAPLLQVTPRPAAARVPVNERVFQAATQQPFQALPSTLPLGKPLADISMGWDGSVWGIDTDGVPHQYDQVAQTWQLYGAGFEAFGLLPDGSTVVARGADVLFDNGVPTPISSVWNSLPDSFAAGLDGIATAQNTLFLFRHGRFLAINPATNAPYGTNMALTDVANWPTTPAWQDGVIEAVGSNPIDTSDSRLTLWTKSEYVVVDMAGPSVVDGPHPISALVGDALSTIMAAGFDAVSVDPDDPADTFTVLQGPLQWSGAGNPVPRYADTFASAWAPTLAHAPSGVTGGLWAATTGSLATLHDGDTWQPAPAPAGGILSLAAGQDGAVFALNEAAVYQLAADGSGWNILAAAPPNAVQVAAGDAEHVWLRTSANGVARLSGSSFNAVNLGQAATHIAANADGTLWHAGTSASAYRFISEGTAPSTALPSVAAGATVVKVASTGFGTAFVLAQSAGGSRGADTTQFYDYVSQYVFKTSAVYTPQVDFGTHLDYQALTQSVALAGHSIFVASSLSHSVLNSTCEIVALDAQTGVELWPEPVKISAGELALAKVMLVYDAALQLVYVTGGSFLYALDVATGTQVWKISAGATGTKALLGAPSLNAGRLCVTDLLSSKLLLFDTVDTLARAKQKQPLLPLWTTPLVNDGVDNFVNTGAPMFDSSGTIYVTVLDLQTRTTAVVAVNSADGSVAWRSAPLSGVSQTLSTLVLDGLIGETQLPTDVSSTTAALFVNVGGAVHALNTADGSVLHSWTGPQDAGTLLSSGLSLLGDRVYAGDTRGTLYVLDALTLTLVTKTGDAPQAGWQGVLSRPALLQSDIAADGMVVCFTRGDQNLWLFDPDTGTLEQVGTDQTSIGVLTYDDTHGLLYGASWNTQAKLNSLGQFFAVRPDQLIQDARAFIIQSQLLQDYGSDAEAAGNGVARYQTHVTVVDLNNAPRANQSAKLWADVDGTQVFIDGATTPTTIGPTTPALLTTDASGSFTITSTAGDLQTTTLRLWAPFMDPHECIAVVPDAEFHGRLATSSASGSTDPQQVDTVSATSYDGTTLFASSEQSQAQNAATATTQLAGAVGMGAAGADSSGSATRTRAQRQGNATSAAADPAPPKYTAYAGLPGMTYSPITVALAQPISVGAPIAFSLDATGHTPLTPAQAANLIDGLAGAAPAGALLGSVSSSLKSAWDEIKSSAATVRKVIVSVGSEVYAGIQYVAKGVTKVVKAIVKDVKDAVAAIGSFFVQLGKDLLKVVEALSILLHLKEVIVTAGLISGVFNDMFSDMGQVLTSGKQELDNLFTSADNWISGEFCSLIASLSLPTPQECGGAAAGGASTPLSDFGGMGATPTTIYTVPSSGGSAPSSSVQCSWSTHTLRTNAGNATPAVGGAQAGVDDFGALLSQMDGVGDTVLNNQALSGALQDIAQSFGATFKASSVEQFMAMAVEDVLEIFKGLLISGVTLVQTLVDGLLATADIVVKGLQALGSVHIPILSALWHKITGNDLSFLDLISFVLAFPVTLVYREMEGSYPVAAGTLDATSGSTQSARILGLVGGTAQLVAGVVLAVLNGISTANADTGFTPSFPKGQPLAAPKPIVLVGGVLLLLSVASSIATAATTSNPAAAVSATLAVLAPTMMMTSRKNPVINSYYSILLTIAGILANAKIYVDLGQPKLTLAREVVAAFPSLIRPVTRFGLPVGLIVPAADVACRWAAGGIQYAQTIENWDVVGAPLPAPAPSPSPSAKSFSRFLPWIRR